MIVRRALLVDQIIALARVGLAVLSRSDKTADVQRARPATAKVKLVKHAPIKHRIK